ncbi:GTPase-activating protein [Wickerhamomyces ciferrii]|uniref:GTPase-activating protein n=1 Tax=Wickerhamomyces ciferrii (strain ATCC 14091 / BCRC 22168 / CBS 111 / JCM 3599 / NBRC 0793 / NRRL Y-1031 F-60-10) TaxID=1206466 RepID=K0KVX1_WICCF|nr:GTPase-activating protein [Wickerhamomyces ciferrii]CCH45258.1 GTPase-activating protein [Wickerhamomyces ciferrii]
MKHNLPPQSCDQDFRNDYTVCLNSYKVEFVENELQPIPTTPTPIKEEDEDPSHLKQDLLKKSVTIDPLSTGYNSSEDVDSILDVIKMDVDRLIIDSIFQNEDIKQDILTILYNYNNFTPYKQGFHEICGLIYLELYKDDPQNPQIKIETFNIFTSLMLSVVPNFYIEDNLIGWCISIFNKYLKLIDDSLYDFLIKTHKIESQIWLIRWVRLLFLRELGMQNTIKILDKFICFDYDLCKLIPFVIIIQLLKIKLNLAECEDNGEVLSLLLHYPHTQMTNEDVKNLIDQSIKLFKSPESELSKLGVQLNKDINKGINWDKVKDMDRLKMELRLQKKVRGLLGRKK